MAPVLNSELFLIPNGSSYLVYAPLRRCVMRLAPEKVNLLVRRVFGSSSEKLTEDGSNRRMAPNSP